MGSTTSWTCSQPAASNARRWSANSDGEPVSGSVDGARRRSRPSAGACRRAVAGTPPPSPTHPTTDRPAATISPSTRSFDLCEAGGRVAVLAPPHVPRVDVGERDVEHPVADRPDHQRRSTLARRAGMQHALPGVVVRAVEVDRAVAQQRADDRERLLEPAHPIVVGEAEGPVVRSDSIRRRARGSAGRRRWRRPSPPAWRASPGRGIPCTPPADRVRSWWSTRRVRRATSTPPTAHAARRRGRTGGGRRARPNRTRPSRRAAPSRSTPGTALPTRPPAAAPRSSSPPPYAPMPDGGG